MSPDRGETVLVVGAGTMGRGIAQVSAAAGYPTRLFDVERSVAQAAVERIGDSMQRRVDKGKMEAAARQATLDRLSVSDNLASAAEGIRWAIEAVPENMDLKVKVLGTVRDAAAPDAVLGSNTSSLSITELGRRLEAGPRCLGMHFFNPPPAMPLLELVRGLHTSEETLARGRDFAAALGKTAIVVNDSPGFATSRLGVAIGAEAIRMLESGVASVEDIDRAMELGYRHPMGPLKLSDLVGLDVRLAILEHLHREVGEQFRPPTLLRQMVRAGWVGKKSGRGFYRWTDEGPVPTDPRA
ncbi:MAG TPA: 3-hydroxyacyl-CoA dehydrogenase family protein [Polyangiaceae bacterium]|nr:3-hydroxyacyl-CoA dehydrogenase family protein [Polyangiaceae bacterium]